MHTGTGLASAWESGLADRQHRQLALAVLASLALHALILFLLSSYKEFTQARAAPPPLTARLAKPVVPSPETPKIEPRPPASPPAPRPASVVKPVAPQPAPAPVPAAAVLSVEPAKHAAEPAFAAPAAPLEGIARTDARADAPPALAAASGPDPGSVARFRLELMEIARRYKRYPRIAQDNNWEGRVELRVAFADNGALASLTVKQGTGRAVLDEEAQAMIRSAQPHASIPPALRGKSFTLEIPVDFFLKDETR